MTPEVVLKSLKAQVGSFSSCTNKDNGNNDDSP
jgi:hypothetical protein